MVKNVCVFLGGGAFRDTFFHFLYLFLIFNAAHSK